ncbi:Uncharacterized protein DAT39_016796, partial [Clarias magur]
MSDEPQREPVSLRPVREPRESAMVRMTFDLNTEPQQSSFTQQNSEEEKRTMERTDDY